jgi:hypothetical protein
MASLINNDPNPAPLAPTPVGGTLPGYGNIGNQDNPGLLNDVTTSNLGVKDTGTTAQGNLGLGFDTSLPGFLQDTYNIQPIGTDPNTALRPTNMATEELKSDAKAGVSAGSQVKASSDSTDAILQTAGAGLVGLLTGGPVGGLVGAATAGLNAYIGLKNTRANIRQQEQLKAELMAREDKQRAQDQGIAAEQRRYARTVAANQSRIDAYTATRNNVMGLLNNSTALKQRFIQSGF